MQFEILQKMKFEIFRNMTSRKRRKNLLEGSLSVGRRLSLITTKVILLGLTDGILFFCTLVRHPFSKLVQFAFIFYSILNQLLD